MELKEVPKHAVTTTPPPPVALILRPGNDGGGGAGAGDKEGKGRELLLGCPLMLHESLFSILSASLPTLAALPPPHELPARPVHLLCSFASPKAGLEHVPLHADEFFL